ncbi:hypothetical protein C1H46_019115 [Malus baccata]|uniref:Uncharacterized protein n=1 Tax=Malus baccata TaxID=106549 RepID=A0A540M990_MALBA|nr:hypothetical protein C1H46_019115 [Malus baccata]
MKDHESLDSRGKKPRRKLFNLELPAEECLSDEDKPDGGLGLGTDKSGCNNNASSSDLHLVRSNGLTDLKEPIQMDKVSASTSVVMSGNHLSSKEEIERQVFFDDLLLSPTTVLMNVSAKPEARIAREPAKLFTSDLDKTEKQIKRTLFGIEISDSDISSSVVALQSDAAISQSSSNWTKPPCSLSQNLTPIQVSTSVNTSTQSNGASIVMPASREVIRDRLLLDCNSIPSTPSLKDEVSHQSSFFFRAKLEANEVQACHPSMSLVRQGNHSSLGHRVDVSAIDVNDVPPNEYLHGVTCGQNIISLQGLRY